MGGREMLAEIKRCIVENDIKGLRYIFADCLDVDPTFEKYRESYEVCKNVPDFFERYQELNEMTADQSKWTRGYWEQLKLDLMKNFSQKRFEHMIEVAKIVYSEKLSRILKERSAAEEKVTAMKKTDGISSPDIPRAREQNTEKKLSDEELQNRRLEAEKRKIEEHNKKIEQEQAARRDRIEASRNLYKKEKNDSALKKASGIAIGIIAVVIVVLIIKVLR